MARKHLATLLGLAFAFAGTLAFAEVTSPGDQEALQAFLRQRLGPPDVCAELQSPTRFQAAWTDLNGDRRPEALVYVYGSQWCGSGGCNLLVLERTPSGLRERGNLTISRPPIGVATTRSHGWRDITVRVEGGGVGGYVAAVPFSGERYSQNPTVAPARRLPNGTGTTVLIATSRSDEGQRVYPQVDAAAVTCPARP